MLYHYLMTNYKAAEPIFFCDLPLNGKPKPELSRELRALCGMGKVRKFDTGVYYLPKKTVLNGTSGPNADMVARYKYISRMGKTSGYYGGNSLANQFGVSAQVPRKPEIVSNNMSAKIKEVSIGNMTFIIRRPTVTVTNENVLALQLLELLKNIDTYMDNGYDEAREPVAAYIRANNISRSTIDRYIRQFPLCVFKNYYEMRLDDVLAS